MGRQAYGTSCLYSTILPRYHRNFVERCPFQRQPYKRHLTGLPPQIAGTALPRRAFRWRQTRVELGMIYQLLHILPLIPLQTVLALRVRWKVALAPEALPS